MEGGPLGRMTVCARLKDGSPTAVGYGPSSQFESTWIGSWETTASTGGLPTACQRLTDYGFDHGENQASETDHSSTSPWVMVVGSG